MVATSPTKPSTPRLSEAARHVIYPSGITTTGWPAVEAKGAELGIHFDPWQTGAGRLILGKRADGKYAATVGGTKLSIPRQVGKTYFVLAVILILCILFPGLKVVWTAHRTRTATNTFRSLQGLARRKKVAPHVDYIRTANGEQEVGFRNGSLIMFGAREQGFGRGFDEVDVEVFDEDQILTEKALEDMIAATNQSRHPHGALLFFMGTPPRPIDPGEAATAKRSKALSGKSDDMVYIEFSADADADPDDREQWSRANPSFPLRTPLESMLRLRENLPSDEAWMREALGVWDARGGSAVIDPISWDLISDPASMAIDNLSLAIDVAPDRSVASVSLAGLRADGTWHVELDEHRHGTGWIIPWVAARCERNTIRAVVIDGGRSPAATMLDDFTKAKIHVTQTSATDMAAACGGFYDAVMEQRVRHTNQPQVNVSLSSAGKRPIGDAWGWNRRGDASDITPIVSVTLALWGAQNSNVKKPTRKGRGSGQRRAVVM